MCSVLMMLSTIPLSTETDNLQVGDLQALHDKTFMQGESDLKAWF